jgi:hypothetical protein
MKQLSPLKKKILVNILAILVYIPLERFIMEKQFSIDTLIMPIVFLLPLTLMIKFKNQ